MPTPPTTSTIFFQGHLHYSGCLVLSGECQKFSDALVNIGWATKAMPEVIYQWRVGPDKNNEAVGSDGAQGLALVDQHFSHVGKLTAPNYSHLPDLQSQ